MSGKITNGRFFYQQSGASSKNGFRWVAGVGAGSRENKVARSCGVNQFGGCFEATNPSFGKYDDVGFGAVSEVVECSNMFRGEHGAGIEGADVMQCNIYFTASKKQSEIMQ